MNFGDVSLSELSLASTENMYKTHNGEVISIILYVNVTEPVTLDIDS